MQQLSISLPSTKRVQLFVKTLTALSGDFEVVSDRHLLDARSLMGLFSLDLTSPITLRVYDDCLDNLNAIKPFLAATEENSHE